MSEETEVRNRELPSRVSKYYYVVTITNVVWCDGVPLRKIIAIVHACLAFLSVTVPRQGCQLTLSAASSDRGIGPCVSGRGRFSEPIRLPLADLSLRLRYPERFSDRCI